MKKAWVLIFFAIVITTPLASAHHSPAAFDVNTLVEIKGKVTRFNWRNPHTYVYVETNDSSGQLQEWLIELDGTPQLSRAGWSPTTLQPGDNVTVQLNPDRNSSRKHGLLVALTEEGGPTLGALPVLANNNAAEDISGKWSALNTLTPELLASIPGPGGAYTEAGQIAQTEFTELDYPPAKCIASTSPFLYIFPPILTEIEIVDDRIFLKSEFYNVKRTVYMDGRSHPENGIRTNQGHSVGHWEGDELIVDTRLYEDHRMANGIGVPSGAQRHTVERFNLSNDKTQLRVDMIVEDPEFLTEPFSLSFLWDYAPEREMQPFECDLESASEYLFE